MKFEAKNYKLKELPFTELSQINGGETGWYYLGRAVGHLRNFRDWLNEQAGTGTGDGYVGAAMNLPG